MKLYHGTNLDFSVIDLAKSNKYKDFGQGFYLTDIRSQAEELAAKKSRLFGGYPVIQEILETPMTTQVQRVFLVNHIVDQLTEYLVTDEGMELVDALKTVYQSKTYNQLQDVDGGLYIQSPSYIYELLQKEQK